MKRHWQNWLWILPLVLLGVTSVRPHWAVAWKRADDLIDTLGILLVAFGIGIRVCARGWKYEAGSGVLVTDGLYGYVRHPLYLGSFLIGLGLCLIIGVFWYVLIYLMAFAWAHLPVIAGEEAGLARRWPKAYTEYRQQVPALLPPLRLLRERRRVRPRRIREAICREADAVCLWPLVAIGLRVWEDAAMDAGLRHHAASVGVLSALALILGIAWLLLKRAKAQLALLCLTIFCARPYSGEPSVVLPERLPAGSGDLASAVWRGWAGAYGLTQSRAVSSGAVFERRSRR
jgi:protein-S-isoprenylcysteine O-methyltransferase Ste14